MNILGTGSAVPRLTVSNDMLSDYVDTSDEWITTRTGIKTRQIITDERFEDLAALAAERAIQAAGLVPEDIDFIICHNVCNVYVTPSLASLVQGALGIKGPNCPTMDINSACAGFVYGLDICDAFLQTGKASKILYVCAEEVTRMVDWTQRETCVLFGDAAGAMVLGPGDNYLASKLTSTPMPDVIYYRLPCEPTPFETGEGIDTHMPMQLKGREVFRMAVNSAQRDIKDVVAKAGLKLEDIDHYLLHQANLRIVDAIKQTFDLPEERFHTNIQRRGNTSSASIPVLLDEVVREGKVKRGDLMVFNGFGAGFVTSAAVVRY
ncbi:MAG: ketoacyl-ACP synthase III [Bacteroidales bacterium]|nr:ketoacyl-ACP synthase III [Bacteroidales bacterium]